MIRFEILSTPEEQQTGLQHRDSLESDKVLVFTNISPGQTFHSENCKFSFTILALDSRNRVLKASIIYPEEEMWHTPPNTTTVIEANQDFCERYNIQVGAKFPFNWK